MQRAIFTGFFTACTSETHSPVGIPNVEAAMYTSRGSPMKTKLICRSTALAAAVFLFVPSALFAAQASGRIEFQAHIAPTGGRPEPVRQMTFYLLSKSMEDIRSEALQLEPAPDFDKFVDGIKESPELKTWMKKHRSVDLAGTDFTKSLTPEEIVDVQIGRAHV